MTLTLRPHQRRCLDAVYEYFTHSTGNCLVVVPTGGGKSLIIAALCHEALQRWPGQRLLILSHVKELVSQDYNELKDYWSKAPAGIYSASLKSRMAHHPITFATIQSVHKKAEILGHRDLVFIDEAHLVSRKNSGMYLTLLARLKQINPRLKVIGLSATPYRLDSGMLCEGEQSLFDDIAIDVPISELLEAGYLCRLRSRASSIKADMEKVGIVAGEYNAAEMEAAFDKDAFTSAVLNEVMPLATGRKAMLFFCSGIDHATHVRDALRARGVVAETVSGKTPHAERDAILEAFKRGEIRALTSVNVVTTGFNARNVDCLVLLRATMSPGLYIQMVGRGLRTFPGKTDCLVLDHAGCIETHGPLTHVTPPRRRTGRKSPVLTEQPKVRICEVCRTAHPLETIECTECGNIMVKERDALAKLETKASDVDILMSDEEYLERTTVWANVDNVNYRRHRKEGKPDSMRVEYQCGLMVYKEWVCPEHGGWSFRTAMNWQEKRLDDRKMIVSTINRLLEISPLFKTPSRIRVRKKDKNFEVVDYDFGPSRQAELAIGA